MQQVNIMSAIVVRIACLHTPMAVWIADRLIIGIKNIVNIEVENIEVGRPSKTKKALPNHAPSQNTPNQATT